MHGPRLRRYFRRRVAFHEIDDLIQEVFLNVHARRARQEIENLERYVLAVAAHVLLRHYSRSRPAELFVAEDPELQIYGMSRSAEDEVLLMEQLNCIATAVESLPSRARVVFVCHRYEAMSYPAIAQYLNISVSAVEKHIMSALKIIRSQLSDDK